MISLIFTGFSPVSPEERGSFRFRFLPFPRGFGILSKSPFLYQIRGIP